MILFLSPFASRPLYGGAVVRIHHLVSGLARRYPVVWACRGPRDPDAPCPTVLNHASRWLQVLNPGYVLRLLPVARRARVLIISSIISGLHALALHYLCGVPLVYDAHNVEHLLLRRLGRGWWPWMAAFEKWLCHAAHRVWVVSDVDADNLHRGLGVPRDKMRVVPNGVDVRGRGASSTPSGEEMVILFFGVLTYPPNVQAVQTIQEAIMPRLEARGSAYRIVIAGIGAAPHEEGRVRWLGYVDDLCGLIQAAHVVIVPLSTGSGTRMKILEAVACGVPVVSTSLGTEGLQVEGVRVADDWDRFVDAILEAAAATRRAPSEAFLEQYTWDRIVERIEPCW